MQWDISCFEIAAAAWRRAAGSSEDAFEEHRQNISSPGGTTWEGDAKDAALDRVAADCAVVGRQSGVLREAADLAQNGYHDIKAARAKAVEAITAAEGDGFSVGADLALTDTRRVDPFSRAARQTSANEHAEDIRWTAVQLVQADQLVGKRLRAKAAELDGIRFDGEGDEYDSPSGHVQLVDNKVRHDAGGPESPGEGPAVPAQAPGRIGPFPVPKSVQDAARKPDAAVPGGKTPDPTGLGDLLGANDSADGTPGEGQPGKPGDEKPTGLPPALSQLPSPPAAGAVDRQGAKVETARQTLADAQAKLDEAAGRGYTQVAGAGPGRDVTDPLSQAVFDARAEVTEQTKILNELNYASAAAGGPTAPVSALPENADVQSFPPKPSAFAEGSRALSEGSLGFIPDVAKDIDVFTNWDQHSGTDRTQALLDSAGLVPLPGAKILGEGLEHGLDALAGASHHLDDAPTPHIDTPPAPHSGADDVASGGDSAPPTGEAPHHAADTPSADHTVDTGPVASYGVEDTSALLTTSEAAGGHLMERHVGQSFDDLSARQASDPRPAAVSTFTTPEEAASAVSAALQHNQAAVADWVANGATDRLRISVPFDGGEVLVRGSAATVPGTSALLVLEGVGNGRWIVLTGYPKP